MCPKGEARGTDAGRPELSRFQAQVVLQLAQWMAATGQGFKDEIQGACRLLGLRVSAGV